jgi:hypothetical protein
VIAEATAVSPEGRITPSDAGLWSDAQIEPLVRINRFVKSQGAVARRAVGPRGTEGGRGAAVGRRRTFG